MLRLSKIIKETIIQKGGVIGFDEFMQLSLYHPSAGYYRSSSPKFGPKGDFTTAPELSPLFGQALAQQLMQYLEGGDILEFGAGTGTLMVQLLQVLEKHKALPKHYYILEISARLRQQQAQYLAEKVPHLYKRCIWLSELPRQFSGVVIANEVLDSLPAKRFIFKDIWQELGVGIKNSQLVWQTKATNIDLRFTPSYGYQTELNLMVKPWLKSLYDCSKRAVVLLIDYGYTHYEYYHPQRTTGTLRCYYRQRVHNNPFIHLGKQDITTSVNFSYVYKEAKVVGFNCLGFTTQGHFLLNLGLMDLLETLGEGDKIKQVQAAKQLILPNAMGESFKVIALAKTTKNKSPPLGFSHGDLTHKL